VGVPLVLGILVDRYIGVRCAAAHAKRCGLALRGPADPWVEASVPSARGRRRRSLVLAALLSVVGHAVMLAGGLVEELWVLVVGRLIYGFGGEALAVLHNAMLISWFSGSALRRTFAISHVVARVVGARPRRRGRRGTLLWRGCSRSGASNTSARGGGAGVRAEPEPDSSGCRRRRHGQRAVDRYEPAEEASRRS